VNDTDARVTEPASQTNNSKSELGAREARLHALMVRARDGDESAYRALLVEVADRLRAFFRARLRRDPSDVEDLVQETLLAVHNQRHTYDADRPLTAWLYAIAQYKLVDLLRRRSRREGQTQPLDDDSDYALESIASDASDARRDLATLLAKLPDRQRLPIEHVKIAGRSVAETARLTGLSESAVKIGVHRGLKALAALVRAAP
jgi:RNA polymerase sigma-70 factor (ECF subfamily)